MYSRRPACAAGHVYSSSVIDTLLAQAYYNPHVITILRLLIAGADIGQLAAASSEDVAVWVPKELSFATKQDLNVPGHAETIRASCELTCRTTASPFSFVARDAWPRMPESE